MGHNPSESQEQGQHHKNQRSSRKKHRQHGGDTKDNLSVSRWQGLKIPVKVEGLKDSGIKLRRRLMRPLPAKNKLQNHNHDTRSDQRQEKFR